MLSSYGLHALEVIDNIFMKDHQNNVSIVISCQFVEKFEYESMREFWLKKIDKLPKMKRKLVKRHGSYWFQEMSTQEW